MSDNQTSIILCEGYHDRAFLQGALLYLGCKDPGEQPGSPRKPVLDTWGKRVVGGAYGYQSKRGDFIVVQPCGGKDRIPVQLRELLQGWQTRRYSRIVVCFDSDGDARQGVSPPEGAAWLEQAVRQADQAAVSKANDFVLFGDKLVVSTLTWWSDDDHTMELPWKQTLERLITASVRAVYPERASAVAAWLAVLPGGAKDGPKEHAWSHMAGFYADNGCEGFCRLVWDDSKIAAQLQRRLSAAGAWRTLEATAL
jgi:hypothetical protein